MYCLHRWPAIPNPVSSSSSSPPSFLKVLEQLLPLAIHFCTLSFSTLVPSPKFWASIVNFKSSSSLSCSLEEPLLGSWRSKNYIIIKDLNCHGAWWTTNRKWSSHTTFSWLADGGDRRLWVIGWSWVLGYILQREKSMRERERERDHMYRLFWGFSFYFIFYFF